MVNKIYKVEEYGFSMREKLIRFDIAKLQYACVNSIFEEKLLMSKLKFLENQIYGDEVSKDERLYKQPAFKENLKKINVVLTRKILPENNSLDKMKVKSIKLSRSNLFSINKIKNQKLKDSELQKKVAYAQSQMKSDEENVKYMKVGFDMKNFYPMGLMDSQGIYDELLNDELRVYADDFRETFSELANNSEMNVKKWIKVIKKGQHCRDTESAKKWIKKLITLELNVDSYKYFLMSNKEELEKIFAVDKNVYAYMAERFVIENGIRGITMLLEDNLQSDFLDVNSKIHLIKYLTEHKSTELFEQRRLIDLIARETECVLNQIIENPNVVSESGKEELYKISEYFSAIKNNELLATLSILNKSGKYGDKLLNLYNQYKGIVDIDEREIIINEFYSLTFFDAARKIKKCVTLFDKLEDLANNNGINFKFKSRTYINYLTNEKIYFNESGEMKYEYNHVDIDKLSESCIIIDNNIIVEKDKLNICGLGGLRLMLLVEDIFEKIPFFKKLSLEIVHGNITVKIKNDEDGKALSNMSGEEMKIIFLSTIKELDNLIGKLISNHFSVISEQGFYQSNVQCLFDEKKIDRYTAIVGGIPDRRTLPSQTREEIDVFLQEIGVLIRTINQEKAFVHEVMTANRAKDFEILISPILFNELISKIKESHLEYIMDKERQESNKEQNIKVRKKI